MLKFILTLQNGATKEAIAKYVKQVFPILPKVIYRRATHTNNNNNLMRLL